MSVYIDSEDPDDSLDIKISHRSHVSAQSVNALCANEPHESSPDNNQKRIIQTSEYAQGRQDVRQDCSRVDPVSAPLDSNPASTTSNPLERGPIDVRRAGSRHVHPQDQWATVAEAFNKYDIHVVRSGKEYIDSLFAPAGLFAAILSAFNIVSYGLLQSDPSQSTPVILAQLSQQLSSMSINGSFIKSTQGPYIPPAPFKPSPSIIVINVLWFSSLVLSLTFVSVGSLVRQWLQEYEALTSSQAYESVCIRQYRYNGFVRWKVSAIMKILPLLLQSALLLFFSGMLVLLWTVNIIVAGVVTVFVVSWLVFLLSTIVLPTYHKDCPYKSAEASVFFTLVQFIKKSLHPFVHYLCMHSDLPRNLETFVWTLREISRKTYDNWREREKDLIKDHLAPLSKQIISFVDEALMDESILGTIVRLYVNDAEHGEDGLDRIVGLLEHAAESDTAGLREWKPNNSRRARALLRCVLDVLKKADPPFLRNKPDIGADDEDTERQTSPQERCELLMVILASYTWENAGDELAQEIFQDIVDLPMHVNLLGVSCETLREYMGAMWRVEETNIDVRAIDHLAQCVAYCREEERWLPQYADDFIWSCIYATRLVARLPFAGPLSPASELSHFDSMLESLGSVFLAIQSGELDLDSIDCLILICEEMRDLADTHAELHPVMRSCVTALIEIHQRPPKGLRTPDYGISYTRERHLSWLTELCQLFSVKHPQGFPLVNMGINRFPSQRDLPSAYEELATNPGSEASHDYTRSLNGRVQSPPLIEHVPEDLSYAAPGDTILQMEDISRGITEIPLEERR